MALIGVSSSAPTAVIRLSWIMAHWRDDDVQKPARSRSWWMVIQPQSTPIIVDFPMKNGDFPYVMGYICIYPLVMTNIATEYHPC